MFHLRLVYISDSSIAISDLQCGSSPGSQLIMMLSPSVLWGSGRLSAEEGLVSISLQQ